MEMDFVDYKDPKYTEWVATLAVEKRLLVEEKSLEELAELSDEDIEERKKLRGEFLRMRAYEAIAKHEQKKEGQFIEQKKEAPESESNPRLLYVHMRGDKCVINGDRKLTFILPSEDDAETYTNAVMYFCNSRSIGYRDRDNVMDLVLKAMNQRLAVTDLNGKEERIEDQPNEDERPYFPIQKVTNGSLAEAIIIAGVPRFLQIDDQGQPVLKEAIEKPDMVLIPLPRIAYLSKSYEFANSEEVKYYLEKAKQSTTTSLFREVKAIWSKYIDAEEDHINICAADTLFTYFQDKLGMTHYLDFVGDNGTGKSNDLTLFQLLGYRPLFDTSITPANIYTYLGSIEEGQGIILEDEADNIDESQEKMRIYKVGYKAGTKVSRIDTSYGRKQQSFWTYCFKAMTAEKVPDATIAKGFNERTFVIQCRAGTPQHDISEVINHGDEPKLKALSDEIEHIRKVLLLYRLIHFKDVIEDVKLSITNREKQLCKPLIRLFRNSSELDTITRTLGHFLDEKRGRKKNTLEARLIAIVKEMIYGTDEDKKEIPESTLTTESIWAKITLEIEGAPPNDKGLSWETPEYGLIAQKKITEILQDRLGARRITKHIIDPSTGKRRSKRALFFDLGILDRVSSLYSETTSIRIITEAEQKQSGAVGTDGTLLDHIEQKHDEDKHTESPDS